MSGKLDEKYELLLAKYKKELEINCYLSLASFCRIVNADVKQMQHWMNRRGIKTVNLRKDAQSKSLGVAYADADSPTSVHLNLWLKYKELIESGQDISMRKFCIQHEVKYGKMQKWMSRNNFNVKELRLRAGIKDKSSDTECEAGAFSESATKVLASCVRKYKRLLRNAPDFKLTVHCKNEGVDYNTMLRWLLHIGMSVKELKQSALLECVNTKKRKPVFVQFKPNGGTNSDKLTGVKIQLADGSNILVEECTVISLCAFINKYDNDQRRKERYDV